MKNLFNDKKGRRAGGKEGKKEENCSLPLMTPSNNISEVRRGPYLPLPRRPT